MEIHTAKPGFEPIRVTAEGVPLRVERQDEESKALQMDDRSAKPGSATYGLSSKFIVLPVPPFPHL